MYLSIADDGYYWTREDQDSKIISGDFGSISHYLPGKMLLHSNRFECENTKSTSWLRMDTDVSNVRLLSVYDPNLAINLLIQCSEPFVRPVHERGEKGGRAGSFLPKERLSKLDP